MSSFNGRTVLVLESRRAREMATLVETFGGRPLVAPSMREVPRETDDDALALADGIVAGTFDAVFLPIGVGALAQLAAVVRSSATGSGELRGGCGVVNRGGGFRRGDFPDRCRCARAAGGRRACRTPRGVRGRAAPQSRDRPGTEADGRHVRARRARVGD